MSLIVRMDNNLNGALRVWGQILFMIIHRFRECPIPASFRKCFQWVIPPKRKTVSHRRDALFICIIKSKLIICETVEQFMPEFICDLIMQHELWPCGFREPANEVAVIFAV